MNNNNKDLHENDHLKVMANHYEKCKKIIIKVVIVTINKFVLIPKFDDAKTLGIIKKITNGFSIPPVK